MAEVLARARKRPRAVSSLPRPALAAKRVRKRGDLEEWGDEREESPEDLSDITLLLCPESLGLETELCRIPWVLVELADLRRGRRRTVECCRF